MKQDFKFLQYYYAINLIILIFLILIIKVNDSIIFYLNLIFLDFNFFMRVFYKLLILQEFEVIMHK